MGKLDSPKRIVVWDFNSQEHTKLKNDVMELAKHIKSANPTPQKAIKKRPQRNGIWVSKSSNPTPQKLDNLIDQAIKCWKIDLSHFTKKKPRKIEVEVISHPSVHKSVQKFQSSLKKKLHSRSKSHHQNPFLDARPRFVNAPNTTSYQTSTGWGSMLLWASKETSLESLLEFK